MTQSIALHPDRLLPADPATRNVARDLVAVAEELPLLSPHGHVTAESIARNEAFPDPAALLISPDHYVYRLLNADGVNLENVNAGTAEDADARDIWRAFCERWELFDGTASGYWLRREFATVFGVDDSTIDGAHADELFDQISEVLARPEFRPRELFRDFDLEVLATTDDPLDDLAAHRELASDPTFDGRVLPTFRPDAFVKFWNPSFARNADRLIQEAGDGLTGYAGYLRAMANRRAYFVENGAVSADHGVWTPESVKLGDQEANDLFEKGLAGTATNAEALRFEANMTYQFARMSSEDGLTMTIHPGSYRDHSSRTVERFGPDTGNDIPFGVDYTRGLQPLLSDFGNSDDFNLVLFTLDETTFSREIAPLAGFYRAVYAGAPWWFLDEPDAMHRFRSATTGTLGFSRTSGFIDDTRAFCSIPARHDAARRVDAGFLAKLVVEHRITEERARSAIVELTDSNPRKVFKL
ncbi:MULTISPECIES: glucuronate isomerase [Micrococcaceae]|uniref:glucuronate isomerase n=1 Tax=unclassified Kocuria TaxID=2649579 RepID=UPI001010B5AB|nr:MULTISPECIES: glucuronate isomerase [unclassified Kocuria]